MAQGQNRNVLQTGQMQNSGSSVSSQPNLVNGIPRVSRRAREEMLNRILTWLHMKQPSKTDVSKAKMVDVAQKLEKALFLTAKSEEDYSDFQTFDARIDATVKLLYQRNPNPSSSVTMTVQTPQASNGWGQSQSYTASPMVHTNTFNSNNNLTGVTNENGRLYPTNRMNGGSIMNVRQQQVSAGVAVSSDDNGQQMMPTPGFNNGVNAGLYGHPSQLQRQTPAGLTDRMQRGNLDSSQLGSGFRSNMYQNASGMINIPQNVGVGTSGNNNVNLVNGTRSSEGVLGSTHFPTLSQPLQQPVDQSQVSHIHRYSMSNSDNFTPGNLYGAQTSSGSMGAAADMDSVILNPMRRVNASFTNNQSVEKTPLPKPQLPQQQFDNGNFQSSSSNSRENISQVNHFNQPTAAQHSQYQQQENLLNNNSYRQPQQASNFISQVKHEPPVEYYNEAFQLQGINKVEPSKSHNVVKDEFICSTQLNIPPAFQPQTRQTQQISQWRDLNNLSSGVQQQTSKDSNGNQREVNLYQRSPMQLESTSDFPSVREPTRAIEAASNTLNGDCSQSNFNMRRWLLFLQHVRKCKATEHNCQSSYCFATKTLMKHVNCCKAPACGYKYCVQTRKLIHHNKHCSNEECPVCVYVKDYMKKHREKVALFQIEHKKESVEPMRAPPVVDVLQPPPKRMKVEKSSQSTYSDMKSVGARFDVPMKTDSSDTSRKIVPVYREVDRSVFQDVSMGRRSGDSSLDEEKPTFNVPKEEKVEQLQPADIAATSNSGKSKIKGVSLIELFTPEQVEEHIRGLRQWVGQSKTKAEKNKAMGQSMSENSCQLCAVERLAFEPTPIYCTPCGARVKRNAMHYTVLIAESRHYVCIPCYNEARTNTVSIDNTPVPKSKFEKKKNDEEIEESWVQCDKCQAWQHQICALFNGRRNIGQAQYTCPNCYIEEVEQGERKPLPQNVILGARSLPPSSLSDHLEQRLFKKLQQERQERARHQGKNYKDVPGADSLVIRVVASIDKVLEVKPRFLDIFREDNYSSEFPYKSKAILLFQKIEGVEVCLFGMYVQEFGTDSASPNQRRVYLSYLDSVKYFRPDVKTVSGEALRTFVYHEILIGYLDYCKKRGFSSCYIWACPPLKGEDYILYCHPEIQKTPKTDKLREWYLAMLRKASKEKVVVECTNFYDHFFVQSGECRAKVTAARLPYFDGDYWPGAAEDLIDQMSQEEDGRKSNRKVMPKKVISKRALKAVGQLDLSVNASKDLLLMHKLGEIILPMKEDFIMVHLQHCCKHCCTLMVSGNRWVCNQCKNFQLCDKCYEVEENRIEKEKHPVNQKEKHLLHPIPIDDVPIEIKDNDGILESEFFDTRQAFLSLCQGNHYQYDTLRRAKHSSMMILYHLHNPTVPAFATACAICQQELEPYKGWRCEVCPDYEVCSPCYSNGINHPHSLTSRPSATDSVVTNTQNSQIHAAQLREIMLHVISCCTSQCQFLRCRQMKQLFRHGIACKVKGCPHCKRMWGLLRLHARNCRDPQCRVPKCRELRAHFSRKQQQADSRRRAAVMEMVRQRAGEAATCTPD